MWLISEFEATTLFSLRLSTATSSGGKTLLTPTPYALKMALLDSACRAVGVKRAESLWLEIRDLEVAIRPCAQVAVTNLFQKILRPRRNPGNRENADWGPFQKTIGYREYAQWIGPLGLALRSNSNKRKDWLADLIIQVNYLGKRGSFVQISRLPIWMDDLPKGYLNVTAEQTNFLVNGTMQLLDDCTPNLTFDKANVYNNEKIRLKTDRIIREIVLPYRLIRSSKSFSLYECIEV